MVHISGAYEHIIIAPPTKGVCPVCAVKHAKGSPHDPGSIYYRARFRRKNRRYPEWEDAMAHCTEEVRAALREKLRR